MIKISYLNHHDLNQPTLAHTKLNNKMNCTQCGYIGHIAKNKHKKHQFDKSQSLRNIMLKQTLSLIRWIIRSSSFLVVVSVMTGATKPHACLLSHIWTQSKTMYKIQLPNSIFTTWYLAGDKLHLQTNTYIKYIKNSS